MVKYLSEIVCIVVNSLPQNTTFFEFQLLHGLNLMIFDADFKSAKRKFVAPCVMVPPAHAYFYKE